ncbi:MAG: cell envelope integrity protein CreD [Bacteroidota bacterium]
MSSSLDRINNWARRSVTLKLFVIGLLILLLLIPASMLDGLIYERQRLRDSAQTEVASKWGLTQRIGGPVISVPYRYEVSSTQDGKVTTSTKSGYAHFLPDVLDITGELLPEERQRGIYVVVLYNSKLKITGQFNRFDATELSIPPEALQWENAGISVGISDMAGIQSAISLQMGDTTLDLGPGTITNQIFTSGASRKFSLTGPDQRVPFSFELDLNGSSAIYFAPYGKRTTVALNGTWANPSFDGTFLPKARTVNNDGFTANWEVLQLNRNFPQQGIGNFIANKLSSSKRSYTDFSANGAAVNEGDFGLRLLLPVDEYQKTYRSTNFAFLFVFITFLTYFFIEVLNKRRVHPIQYLLIGAAILLFYVMLLSISEHLTFNYAYWISCAAIVLLISTYSWFVLRNTKLTVLIAAVLIILYVFFYSLLQLQDYALLFGSLGLFFILATIMYFTRNIDWYRLNE